MESINGMVATLCNIWLEKQTNQKMHFSVNYSTVYSFTLSGDLLTTAVANEAVANVFIW